MFQRLCEWQNRVRKNSSIKSQSVDVDKFFKSLIMAIIRQWPCWVIVRTVRPELFRNVYFQDFSS